MFVVYDEDRARAGAAADEGDARTTGQEGRQRRQDGQVWQRGTVPYLCILLRTSLAGRHTTLFVYPIADTCGREVQVPYYVSYYGPFLQRYSTLFAHPALDTCGSELPGTLQFLTIHNMNTWYFCTRYMFNT